MGVIEGIRFQQSTLYMLNATYIIINQQRNELMLFVRMKQNQREFEQSTFISDALPY